MDKAAARQIIEQIKAGELSDRESLHEAKLSLARNTDMAGLPSNADILEHVTDDELDSVQSVLARKPTRTISGVATLAVMWMWNPEQSDADEQGAGEPGAGDSVSGFSCPYNCVYCPQGTHEGRTAPKSYTGKEPSARRAIANAYDPYKQVSARLQQYKAMGQPADKAEIIVMGGTFPATPRSFQQRFIKRCFDALNGEDADDLVAAQRLNETADRRNVGLTIETRPDFTTRQHVNDFLDYGCTRVEIGVQTLDDTVHAVTDRGHTTADVVTSTRRLKDCGFKITYHMMLGLPGESRKQDVNKFETLFSDARFQPDELKIYPTAVIQGTTLHDMMEDGAYEPLTEDEVYDRLLEIKPGIPEYCRIKRIMRDIPSTEIDDGASRTNARQLLHEKMAEREVECRCIRCREAGHVKQRTGRTPDRAELVEREYDASAGSEQFLSIEDPDQDILMGYLRLRFPDDPLRPEIGDDTAIVRQLQVVGPAVPIGDHDDRIQHSGYGKRLMRAAVERARDAGYQKLAVISAVGTREYYRNLGYERDGPYMSKTL